jgi:Tfp pilus assembly protein PilF
LRWNRWLSEDVLLRLLFIAVVAVFVQTMFFDFVYDDHMMLTNPWLSSWSGLKPMFTEHSWSWDGSAPARHYRPFVLLWLSVAVRLGGGVPGWMHLWAVFTHMAAVYLAYVLAKKILRDGPAAVLATMIFALHPTKAEGVGWISADEPILAVFFFASLLCYLRWREASHRLGWLVATFLCCMAATLTKETAVVLPAVFLAYEVAFASDGKGFAWRKMVWLAAPGVLAACAFLAIRGRILGGLGDEAAKMPLSTNLFTAPVAFWLYVRQLVWPVHMSPLYPTTIVARFSVGRVLIPAVAMVAVVALYWYWVRRSGTFSAVLKFAAAWYLLILLPVMSQFNWVQLRDRHLYLPTFAVGLMVAVALQQIRWPKQIDAVQARAVTAIALALVMSVVCARELRIWETDRTAFERAVEVSPRNAEAIDLLAETYESTGQDEKAVAIWKDGIARVPESPRLIFALGSHYYARGDYQSALPYLERMANLKNPLALFDLGVTESRLGMKERAIEHLSMAVELAPHKAGFRKTLEAVQRSSAQDSSE